MTLGPLEFLVVGFEGNRFTGQILPELRAAREKGIIRVVDLIFLRKGASGDVAVVEMSDLGGEEAEHLAPLAGDLTSLLSAEDIELLAHDIPSNCSAAIVLFEHTWAIGLKEAIKNASGVAVAGGLVAPEMVRELEEELEAAQQSVRQEQVAIKATE